MHSFAATYSSKPASTLPSAAAPVGLLAAAAATPRLLWCLAMIGVFVPLGRWIFPAIALFAVVSTLVWLHGAFGALRGRAKYSPGMAVGGWFIPLANLLLPALILRDGLRASTGQGGGIAFGWMITWWLATAAGMLRGLDISFSSMDGGPVSVLLAGKSAFDVPGVSVELVGYAYSIATIAIDLAAFGLLAMIVGRIARGGR